MLSEETVSGQKLLHIIKRQSHDIGIGTLQETDKHRRPPLDGVASRLALPFAAFNISVGLDVVQGFEFDDAIAKPDPPRPSGVIRQIPP